MITFDLDSYWVFVSAILVVLAAQWGFRRVKSLISRTN